jgi:hypothetical protein
MAIRRCAALLMMTACGPSDVARDAPAGVDERACPQIRGLSTACGDLLSEPVFVTLVDKSSGQANEVGLVGAVSGNTCTLKMFSATNNVDHVTSLAVIGTDIFYCANSAAEGAGTLTRVSLIDSTVTLSPVSCLSVTAVGDKLEVLTSAGTTVQEYASFAAVLAQTSTTKTIGESGVRLGADEARIYSSGPMFDAFYTFDVATNASSRVSVAGASIHVDGLSAQGGHVLVLDGFSFDQWLYSFDASTGAQLSKVVAATQVTRLHGLSNACEKATLQ